MDKHNVAKEITSAVLFEEELQLSWKEGGITIVDVHSAIWGPCRAIAPTFRRLYFGAEESTKLRFLMVDATLVLEELDGKSEDVPRREFPRPRDLHQVRDTLPEFWRSHLTQQEESPKPLFMFWKEGKFVQAIEGVNTPAICDIVSDLTAIKTPASEYLTSPILIETWGDYFNPAESDVRWDTFVSAMNSICKLTVPLDEEETATLKRALNVGTERHVTAQELQNWVSATNSPGGNGNATILQAFTQLLPNYEERAIQVRIEQEASAQRRATENETRERERAERERQEQLKAEEEEAVVRAQRERAASLAAAINLPESEPNSRSGSVIASGRSNATNGEGGAADDGGPVGAAADLAKADDLGGLKSLFGAIREGGGDLLREVNHQDEERKWTALHYACHSGNQDMVELLLEAGGEQKSDGEGQTPIFIAQEAGHMQLVEWLITKGVNF